MSTTVTFSGYLAEDPELLHTHDGKPFVSCRVMVSRRVKNAAGEWVNSEPVAHHVKVYGSAATEVHGCLGAGDPIIVHGLQRTESWLDKESGTRGSKSVVVVDNRFGEVGVSLGYA
jgi:single-strand DNA-binding protein